jgi:hypothetical protein
VRDRAPQESAVDSLEGLCMKRVLLAVVSACLLGALLFPIPEASAKTTPRGEITEVRGDLADLIGLGSRKTDRKLDQATDRLDNAIDGDNWAERPGRSTH